MKQAAYKMHHVITALHRERQRLKTSEALAAAAEVSPQFVCDCLKGHRRITGKLLRYLGFRAVVTYVRVSSEPAVEAAP